MTTDIAPPSPTDGFLVAVGGSEGGAIDQHFGQAEEFLVYRIGAGGGRLVERRSIAALALPGEDRRATIARMLGDCRMLLVAKVGDTPRAIMAEAGVEATDRFAGRPVAAVLAELAV